MNNTHGLTKKEYQENIEGFSIKSMYIGKNHNIDAGF